MNTINTIVLNFTVAIIDFLYQGRDFQRSLGFGRDSTGTILCFLKCFTFKRIFRFEILQHLYLMKEHFAQNSK